MKYRVIGSDPKTRREVSVVSLGSMLFGTVTDEATSFALLDRFVEAGGTFIDTSNNYSFWVNGTQGGESEELLGRWIRSRGIGDEITFATKLGARPNAPTSGFSLDIEGLSAKVIRESAERSRDRLGIERIHLLYAHVMDEHTPWRRPSRPSAGSSRTASPDCSAPATTGPGGWSGPGRWPRPPDCPATRCSSTTTATCASAWTPRACAPRRQPGPRQRRPAQLRAGHSLAHPGRLHAAALRRVRP